MNDCELCRGDGGRLIARTDRLRVVLVDEPDYPGFVRVIWGSHVRELTDLPSPQRALLMDIVFGVEIVMREVMQPHKVNVASLGNVTPHLHWHVIPRFADDAHFPNPIWGVRQRETDPRALAQRKSHVERLCERLAGTVITNTRRASAAQTPSASH